MLHRILKLVKKDFLLEWRQKYSIYGLLLYLCSAVFTINLLENKPEGTIWNSFFWIILLFISVNAVAKSFLQEPPSRTLYYYTMHSPQEIILSKLIYNVLLLLFMSVGSYCLFIFLLGNPCLKPFTFLGMVLLGGISLSILFTMLSAIASKAGGNSALIAILGFPLVIPQLILLSDLSKPFFQSVYVTGWCNFFFALVLLDIMLIALSYILFPFLWKD